MDLTRVRFVRGWGLLLCAAALLAPGTHSYAATTSPSALTAEKLLPDDTLVVVIPEFVPAKLWEKILHNHSGLMLKFALLSQRNVVVCNVRYFLDPCPGPVRFAADPGSSTSASGNGQTPGVLSGVGHEVGARTPP